MDLWRCGRIRCLHLIRIASCKTYSLQWFRVLGASFSRFWGLRFRSRVLRFRVLGASFTRFGCFVFDLGCFVFEFWVLRFRDLDASCFGLRFRVLRFRNYLPVSVIIDDLYFKISCRVSTPLKARLFGRIHWDSLKNKNR